MTLVVASASLPGERLDSGGAWMRARRPFAFRIQTEVQAAVEALGLDAAG